MQGRVQVLVSCKKFAPAFPTKNKPDRSTIDKLFNKYFLDFEFPKRIIHDQSKEVVGC